ncbi:MAG: 3-dehydroquinate dehydratase [Actinomycetota bacterium]|nr:3-dehydroquinate dehydratase [Actinomycetota bacterium]
MRVAVLNGVNLDVLHRRDSELYGGISLNQLESRIYAWAREFELLADCRQTNSEAEYVGWCHDAFDWAGGVIVNPGAWTHYSYAIRDALELLRVPLVEVHLSDVDAREDWRRHSVLADIAARRILGKGPEGYREALGFLAERPQ